MSIGRRWKGLARAMGLGAALALALGTDGHAQTEPSGWSTPENLGSVINSPCNEDLPHISRDGLSLYFISNRTSATSCGPLTDFDIWVSHRQAPGDPWPRPTRLGPEINTGFNERGPCLSPDGHRLLFSSNRPHPDAHGSQDLWMSYREDTSDDSGWQTPVNMGSAVNTTDPDFGSALLEDENGEISALLFGRRVGGGQADIYMSTSFHVNNKYGPFGGFGVLRQSAVVRELSTKFDDLRPTIRADGLELFFNSNRPLLPEDDLPRSNDIWVSTRPVQSEPWSAPVNLRGINTDFEEQFPAVSADGSMLIFSSNRTGSQGAGTNDLWVSRRNTVNIPFPWP